MQAERDDGAIKTVALSRQMVLFCVERRKGWRLLQSRSGITNPDYEAQRDLLRRVDDGEIDSDDFRRSARTWLEAEREATDAKKPRTPASA